LKRTYAKSIKCETIVVNAMITCSDVMNGLKKSIFKLIKK